VRCWSLPALNPHRAPQRTRCGPPHAAWGSQAVRGVVLSAMNTAAARRRSFASATAPAPPPCAAWQKCEPSSVRAQQPPHASVATAISCRHAGCITYHRDVARPHRRCLRGGNSSGSVPRPGPARRAARHMLPLNPASRAGEESKCKRARPPPVAPPPVALRHLSHLRPISPTRPDRASALAQPGLSRGRAHPWTCAPCPHPWTCQSAVAPR
jgi:hypothetical protein